MNCGKLWEYMIYVLNVDINEILIELMIKKICLCYYICFIHTYV